MEDETRLHGMTRGAHVLVIPLPLQGHINPMLQFSKRSASKGLKITFLTTFADGRSQFDSLRVHPISGWFREDDGEKVENLIGRFQTTVSQRLPDLIAQLDEDSTSSPIRCLVYDSGMPWALDLAKRLGLACASFFTHSCAVAAIYSHLHRGFLTAPVDYPTVSLPGLPLLESSDLPSFVYDPKSYPSFLDLVKNRFLNVEKADWIFFSSFESLEKEVINWMSSQWTIKAIGPTLPSMYLDKRLEHDKDYALNLFKPNFDTCKNWLDSKERSSVVYASFGSIASIGDQQMKEISWGLKNSDKYFLLVVRDSELEKLPHDFVNETSDKGLVVNWCPQLDVLGHSAIGCFITHCGWNSTLEALSLGVPMVAMPQWTDQTTNAKFVSDVWSCGVRAKVGERGVVDREEVVRCVREVIDGEKGEDIRRSAERWRKLAIEAVDEGGSSDMNIDEFVSELLSR